MLSPTARIGLFAAVSSFLLSGCGAPDAGPSAATPAGPVTSTTQIASAGVLGNQRRPDESCAPQPAPADPDVHSNPQRIVALATAQLDALCALGLQGRVVGTALPQPSYLGTVLHDAPGVGERGTPDLAAIRTAAPDLILGAVTQTPDDFDALAQIAPTVFTGGPAWQDTLRAVAEATGRSGAADRVLGDFQRDAHEAGLRVDATHFQVSVIQFTTDTMRVYGAANFPAAVLHAVGVDRPAAQRFTDQPFIEVSLAELTADTDLSAADGDIVYLSFDSPAAKDLAPSVLHSDAWRKLSANRDNRVFVVNNEVWHNGRGVVAARGIVDDLRWLNAPIN